MNRLISALFASVLSTASVQAQQAPARPQVVSIRAYPFDSDTGQFQTKSVLPPEGSGMVNDTWLDALAIVVEVEGPHGANYLQQGKSPYSVRVHVKASEGGTKMSSQSRPLVKLGSSGKRYVSFMVYDTQCVPVTIVAQIAGPGKSKPVEVMGSFMCGKG